MDAGLKGFLITGALFTGLLWLGSGGISIIAFFVGGIIGYFVFPKFVKEGGE